MPETLVKPANTIKTKTSKERYAILSPLDETRGIFKVYTDYGTSTLQQVRRTDAVFVPAKICKILSADIEAIIFGLTLGSEFYASTSGEDGLEPNSLEDILIYESLAGVQTFYGTVNQFINQEVQKNIQK